MNILYTLEDEEIFNDSIFLAGPTYRTSQYKDGIAPHSWRKDAIELFRHSGLFKLTLLVPEYRNDVRPNDWTYNKQVEWETKMLKRANIILFWIPRSTELPALTTNVEFGEWLHSGKIVCGSPIDAMNNRYLIKRFQDIGGKWNQTLEECVNECVTRKKMY